MKDDGLPDSVKAFLQSSVSSVEELEILLLLRAHPSRCWTVEQVSDEVRSGASSAATRLEDLRGRGLVDVHEGALRNYSYAMQTADVETALAGVERAYTTHRHRVIDLIFSKPIERIRVFASAFDFRKRKPHGDG